MIKNYIKVAWRNILRFKGHSLINITGLAVSLMFCILAVIFVRHERSFDRFHDKADRIHLLYHQAGSIDRKPSGSTPPVLAPTIAESVPGIERIVRVYGWDLKDGAPVRSQDRILMMRGFHVDPDFLGMFSFPYVSGERETALNDLSSMVITRSMAESLFGDRDPLGQEVQVQLRDGEKSFFVKSVIRLPRSSSMRFDFLINYQNRGQWSRNWGANNVYTYVLLEKGVTRKDMEERLLGFFKNYFKEGTTSGRTHFGSADRPVKLMPLTDMYLNTEIREWLTIQSDPASSSILIGIALAVLLTACVNFINLSLGISARRSKEVGLRKVVGAGRSQIIRQHLSESLLLTLIALVVGLILTAIVVPSFGHLMDRELSFELNRLILPLLAIAIIVGAAAGIYPALVLAGLEPHTALKGRFVFKPKNPIGTALLIFQFGISLGLIAATLVMTSQMRHMRKKNLGFDPQQVVVIDGGGRWVGMDETAMRRVLAEYRKAADQYQEIESATMTSMLFVSQSQWGTGFDVDGKEIPIRMYAVDYDYIRTIGACMVQGREFSRDFPGDAQNSVMVNQRLVRAMGWEDPIGQSFPAEREDLSGQVIGVVGDMHLKSLHNEIMPAVFHLQARNGFYRYILIRGQTEDWRRTLEHIRSIWRNAAPGRPFQYKFLDDEVDRIFREDQRWADLTLYASVFAVLIACMGAFGLISLALTRRTKEIGIRKVLGASEGSILTLMTKDFLVLIAAATAVSYPITYFLLQGWLQNFAYRIKLSFLPFVIGMLITTSVIMGSILFKIIKTARANPVEALRYE
jgi:putative ABC transport system permease protein